jgi:hypothetical protein
MFYALQKYCTLRAYKIKVAVLQGVIMSCGKYTVLSSGYSSGERTEPFEACSTADATSSPMQSWIALTSTPRSSLRRGATGLRRNLSSGPDFGRPYKSNQIFAATPHPCCSLVLHHARSEHISTFREENRGTYACMQNYDFMKTGNARMAVSRSNTTRMHTDRLPWSSQHRAITSAGNRQAIRSWVAAK